MPERGIFSVRRCKRVCLSVRDGTLDLIFDAYGINAPLASLIYSDMDKSVKFTKSKYFGTMDVAGVACDYNENIPLSKKYK